MAALTKERDTPRKHVHYVYDDLGVAASAKIFNGSIVSANATGFAKPGADVASELCLGRARETVDNTGGADGAKKISIDCGIFAYNTTGGNAITSADVGKIAEVLDDNNVVRAAGTTNHVKAGKVVAFVSSSEVYIDFLVKA